MLVILFMVLETSCVTKIVHDSELPLDAYDSAGKLVEGYRCYSNGVMADLLKCCKNKLNKITEKERNNEKNCWYFSGSYICIEPFDSSNAVSSFSSTESK